METVLFVFIVFRLLIGAFRVADYGLSYDEGFGYTDLQMNDAYIREFFSQLLHHQPLVDTTGYEEYFDKNYGIAARFPLLLLQRYVEGSWQIRDIFLVHHYYQYFWFILAVFSLYQMGRLSGFDQKRSLIGCVMLVMMPRLFAEAAYNYKDILFLSLFIIAYTMALRLLQRWTVRRMVVFAFFMALCVNTRYIGGVIFVIFTVIYILKGDEHKWKRWGGTAIVTALFYYIISPFLWKNPIGGVVDLVAGFNHFSWNGPVKVMGKVFAATELPWYYLTVYMLSTIPLWVILLAVAGIAGGVFQVVKKIRKKELNKLKLRNAEITSITGWMPTVLFVAILLMDLIVHPVKYDGWRHFYFLYPMIIITALQGMDWLLSMVKKQQYHRMFGGLAVALIVTDLFWMEMNHPYEYMYFNPVGRIVEDGFDGDYWLVSTYDAIRDVLDVSDRNDISIWFSQEMAFYFLSDEEMGRLIWQTDTASGADVIILHERTDFMFDMTDVDWSQYVLWKEIYIDSKLLYAIYLKKV